MIEIENSSVVLRIWDTAGSERYESMTRMYYKGANAAIVCFDLSDVSSFEKVDFWISELRENEPDCLLFLAGTKCDKEKIVSQSHIEECCKKHNISPQFVFETSAKTNTNINELFECIARQGILLTNIDTDKKDVINTDQANTENTGCCR